MPRMMITSPQNDRQFALDGEKFSAPMLRDYHIPQPGAPEHFARSTLLVGARGVGKTFLLRHRKATSHPEAHYVNLQRRLISLTEEGIAGGASDLPPRTAAQVVAKSCALLVSAVLESAPPEALPPENLLRRLLPADQSRRVSRLNAEAFRRIASSIDLFEWPESPSRSFIEVLTYIHERAPLSLFLDRADDIPEPASRHFAKLLDQSVPFKAVIATRPGALQFSPFGQGEQLIPGDHFDVVHLGADPSADGWSDFFENCIRQTMHMLERPIPEDIDISWISALSRESTRNGIEYAQEAGRLPYPIDRVGPMSIKRRAKLDSVASALADHAPQLHTAIGNIVKEVQARDIAGSCTTLVDITSMNQPQKINRDDPLHRFL